jgi:glycosyltransferase involved in cell wall biosynthesis
MIPKYSIVCAAYNVEPYIDETVESVLGQIEKDWELIIVDDGSTDGTVERVQRYSDSRIRLIRQANGGPSAARNTGIAASRGARIVVLDSDDCLHPSALQLLGGSLDRGKAVASYGQCRIVTETGRFIGFLYRPRRGYPPSGDVLRFILERNLFVNGGHLCMDAAVARSLGPFRIDLPVGEDHEYWCRLAARGPIMYIGNEPAILDYRRRPGGWYKRQGRSAAYHARFIDAVFSTPELMSRFSQREQHRLRLAAEATANWIIAREHIRYGDWAAARPFLAKSLRRKLHYKRAIVLLFSLLGGVPDMLQRRFPDIKRYEFLH